MSEISKVHKIIIRKLELWIPAILAGLGFFLLSVFRDWLNVQLLYLVKPDQVLQVSEYLILLILVMGIYLLLFRSKSKREVMELKAFVNKRVYSSNNIHNQFDTNNPFRNIEDHLSWRPFYEALEKKTEEQKA